EQRLMHAIQHAVAAPIPEIVVNRGVRWKILRQLPPLTTAAVDIPDGVEDLAHISLAAAPSSARRRDHRRDHRPLLVAHVTRIAAPARRVRLAMGVGPHGSSPDSAAIDRITPDSYDSRTFETGSQALYSGGRQGHSPRVYRMAGQAPARVLLRPQ